MARPRPHPWFLAAVGLDVLLITILTRISDNPDAPRLYISALGAVDASHMGWYQIALSIGSVGHLAVVLAIGRNGGWRRWTPWLLLTFVVTTWLGAIAFPCDPECVETTTRGYTHLYLGYIGFVGFLGGVFGQALQARSQGAPRALWLTTGLAPTILGFALIVADVTSWAWAGVVERAYLLVAGLAIAWDP